MAVLIAVGGREHAVHDLLLRRGLKCKKCRQDLGVCENGCGSSAWQVKVGVIGSTVRSKTRESGRVK